MTGFKFNIAQYLVVSHYSPITCWQGCFLLGHTLVYFEGIYFFAVELLRTVDFVVVEQEELVKYYSRDDVSREMVKFAHNREFIGRFREGGYSSRPGTALYPGDIVRMANQGMVSFHASVELWDNPMNLEGASRLGWDLLIDLDADTLENGRIAAEAIVEILRAHGVESVYIKFSGRSGFHIFVPWKAFKPSFSNSFPEIPRAIGRYIEEYLREDLPKKVMSGIEVDSVAISPRHLMRAPYSLNEKVWMVSIPVDDPWFDIEDAQVENIVVRPFELSAKPEEAVNLVDLSLEYVSRKEGKRESATKITVKGKVAEEFFSPCIKKILQGLSDGRKRGEFILRTYLSNLGWNWEEIEKFLLDWNKKNKPPMRENYITGHVRWHKRQKKNILPPNHDRDGFYKDMGVWTHECANLKNPITYTLRKYRRYLKYRQDEKEKEKKKKPVTKKPEKKDST